VKELLAYQLLKLAENMLDDNPELRDKLYSYLRKQRAVIFLRILLRVMVHLDDVEGATVWLVSSEFWKQPGIDPERNMIANAFLSRLTDDQFEGAMSGLRSAVQKHVFIEWTKSTKGSDPSESDIQNFVQSRLLESYAPIANSLRGSAKDDCDRLKHELGEPPDKDQDNGVWFGPTSPKSSEELESMLPDEILAFLKEWKPMIGWRQHSPEGLGRSLQPLVAREPTKYLVLVREISELQPVYIRNIVAGLHDAVKAKVVTAWEPLIGAIEVIVERSEGEVPAGFEKLAVFNADHNWTGVRHKLALLIEEILRSDSLPVALADRVWLVLVRLSADSDPTPDAEEKQHWSNLGDAALNSVRGAAMLAVVRFTFWAYQRHKDAQFLDDQPLRRAFDVLTAHLDPNIDPSIAIRAIYGEYLPWLQEVGEVWVAENVTKIFPSGLDQAKLRHAAWSTYLLFCPIYQKTYDLLKDIYAEEVRNLDPSTPTDHYEVMAREHLVQHIWVAYARGDGDLKDPDSLIRLFIEKSSDDLKEVLVSSIGRALQTDSTLTAEPIERLCALWNSILNWADATPGSDKVRVLRAFGWWFASERLDEGWAFEQLAAVLSRTSGRADPEFRVLPRLAELSERYPLATVQLLKQMAVALEPLHLVNIKEHAGPIMQHAVDAGGAAATTAAQVHTLLSNQGMRDFRGLFEL
jgi:hypothetical protein